MGINPIAGGISTYYRASEIPAVSIEEAEKKIQQQSEASVQESDYSRLSEQTKIDTRSRTADLENISLTFNKQDDFGYIGSESGLADLDVQQAISDMRKDEVLQEYQYFVGSGRNLLQSSEDGQVIIKS